MSQCYWCDTCERPYSDLDLDARAIQVQEPDLVNGIKRGVITVERHQCGTCTRRQQGDRQRRLRELAAAEEAAEKLSGPPMHVQTEA